MSAQFPTGMPVLFDDKTTANDVSDAAHWDGADANIVKAEIAALAAKVGVDGDGNDASHDFKIAALEGATAGLSGDVAMLDGRVGELETRTAVTTGGDTLAASTTTVINDASVTASSTVVVQARSSAFTALGVYVSAQAAGSFTLTHAAAAGTETFDYVVVN